MKTTASAWIASEAKRTTASSPTSRQKLLPVSDNLKRALETEASVEAAESDEFRHFLSGVDLIWKQLSGVLDALGVKPISAVGEQFDPHIHEAVVTEATDEYEPDTVMQEIRSGYRIGDKLIRPALVKVATRKPKHVRIYNGKSDWHRFRHDELLRRRS